MQSVLALLPLIALVAAAPAPLAQGLVDLPVAPRNEIYPSINIRAVASTQLTKPTTIARLTSPAAYTKKATQTTSIAKPRMAITTIPTPVHPPSRTASATSTSTNPIQTNRAFKITLLPIIITNSTSSNNSSISSKAVTPAQNPVGYLGTDASNTWPLSNLISLRKLKAKAAVFELSSDYKLKQRLSTADPKTLLRVQAAKAGENYAGLGAAQMGFGNGEDLTCTVEQVQVSVTGPKGKVTTVHTEDRLRCKTPSNGHAVLGKCKRFTWMWLFGTVEDVKAFCPGGSGALEMGIVWLKN